MAQKEQDGPSVEEIEQAKYIRKLRDRALLIGKKTTMDVFVLGEIFEEASQLLRGRFSTWVEHECRIEKRTAHGYRQVHVHLQPYKSLLIDQQVLPTVAIRLAAIDNKAQARAIDVIRAGRRLKVKDLQKLAKETSVGDAEQGTTRDPRAELKALFASAAGRLAERVRAVVEQAEAIEAGSEDISRLVNEAAALGQSLSAMMPLLTEMGTPVPEAWETLKASLRRIGAGRVGNAEISTLISAWETLKSPPAPRGPLTGDHSPVGLPAAAREGAADAVADKLTVLEVCAGAGGQAHGLARAGFHHVALVENDRHACETLRANFRGDLVVEQDLRIFDPTPYRGVDLFCGGVPCQPFSASGEGRGKDDERDLFPVALDIVEQVRPRAVMIENVKGIMFPAFDAYRLDIILRLERLGYEVEWKVLNATDFGVPQRRERAVLVAFRDGLMQHFHWPTGHPHYQENPRDLGDALGTIIADGGWEGAAHWAAYEAVRPALTIVGGSAKKQGMDLGQNNSRRAWRSMGMTRQISSGYVPNAALA